MLGSIFLVTDDDELVEMREQPYDSEELLQELLAKYPRLLAGDQVDSTRPRRWLLVTREAGVPSEEAGGERWSVDHLFLDQDGVPTLIEVKRSSDTRIRREVVGQMMDYAANALLYWPVERVQAWFEARCQAEALDPDQVLTDVLDEGDEMEDFWERVKTNLQAGKVRMIFVADIIPSELRRIVEFLDRQMDPAQVRAIEVKQFVGQAGEPRTLVPRVLGQTEASPAAGPGEVWTEERFFQVLAEVDSTVVARVREILEWARSNEVTVAWGRGRQYGTFTLSVEHNDYKYRPVSIWTLASVQVNFGQLKSSPPFDAEAKRLELLRRLNEIPGVELPAEGVGKQPSFPVSALKDARSLGRFLEALEWVFNEARRS